MAISGGPPRPTPISTGVTSTPRAPGQLAPVVYFGGGGVAPQGNGVPAARFYPELFGAIGNSTQDDTASLNAAITAARKVGGTLVLLGRYLVTAPLDLTFPAGADPLTRRAITIRSEGGMGIGNDLSSGIIVAKHNGHVFDCAGSQDLVFENVNVTTDAVVKPVTCWFFARNTALSNAGSNRLTNCRTYGAFTDSVVYSYAAELNQYDGCSFFNTAGTVFTITGSNINGRTSSFIAIAAGAQSNIVHRIFGGDYNSNVANGIVFYLEGVSGLLVKGAWMYAASGAANGDSLVVTDVSITSSDYCWFENCVGENGAFLQAFGFRFTNQARQCTRWTIRDCRISNATFLFDSAANVTMNSLRCEQLLETGASHGIRVQGVLINSRLDVDCPVIAPTPIGCHFRGDPANFTLGAGINTVEDIATGSHDLRGGGSYKVASTKVVGAREVGYTAGTGTPNKGAFAADTATAVQAAQRVLALEQTLRTHGLIN